jgi:hypothetical protein
MNKFIKATFSLLAFLALPAFAAAQIAVVNTTLSGAITAAQTTIQVASATGIVAPNPFGGPAQTPGFNTTLVVDNESLTVEAVSGTQVTVVRGANGTKAASHNAADVVWVGNPNIFLSTIPSGVCTPSITYTPTLVVAPAYQSRVSYWNCVTLSSGVYAWEPVLSTGAITPVASAAAIGVAGQTFTVEGLVKGEPVIIASAPAATALCPLVQAETTAANTVTLYYATMTAAACTPAAGTYLLSVPRFQ